MTELATVVVGLLPSATILFASWLMLRRRVKARLLGSPLWLLALDAAPIILVWIVLTCLIARPLLSACVVAAMAFGLARGDAAKLKASGEPLVFTDGLLGSIVIYPSLYAEFVTPVKLVCSTVAVLLLFVLLGSLEEPAWHAHWPAVVALLLVAAVWFTYPRAEVVVAFFRRRNAPPVTGRPVVDSAAIGPFAVIAAHTATAQVEREGRRRNRAPGHSDALPDTGLPTGPIVMLQMESFFDARRLCLPMVPADLLPHYDRCVAGSIRHGRLHTPAYGANTVRTEFAALTGLSEGHLGLDHFNPYAAFARRPVDSIAWRLRAAGFKTICVHPFAGTFYGRHRVMPNLGFDEFHDVAAFTGRDTTRTYVSDMTVIEEVERLLSEHGPRTFIFAITMGNHSPWPRAQNCPALPVPQGGRFASFLSGLAETDAALGEMASVMRRQWKHGLLAAFGDHQPSFGPLYRHLAHIERTTEYLIWRADHAFGEHRDIQAHELPGLILGDSAKLAAAKLSPLPHVIGRPI
ncbi:LTA synthase family protein [Acidisphaera sp. L21]|uniref:LTA synthase family protein n=1 Tax=Acidisphaera sp. L21 TaxID=1641851 RepID=UPI00131EB53C|nr:LTA synthase family protein [Acidisphaera sp. L21]